MARASQKSPQTRHSTPYRGRQSSPMTALQDQAGWSSAHQQCLRLATGDTVAAEGAFASAKVERRIAAITRHQNMRRTAVMHALQRVQRSMKSLSGKAQGGRCSTRGRGRPRKKARQEDPPRASRLLCSFHLVDAATQHLVDFEPGSTCGKALPNGRCPACCRRAPWLPRRPGTGCGRVWGRA